MEYNPLTVAELRAAIEELPNDTKVLLVYDCGCATGDLLDINIESDILYLGTM